MHLEAFEGDIFDIFAAFFGDFLEDVVEFDAFIGLIGYGEGLIVGRIEPIDFLPSVDGEVVGDGFVVVESVDGVGVGIDIDDIVLSGVILRTIFIILHESGEHGIVGDDLLEHGIIHALCDLLLHFGCFGELIDLRQKIGVFKDFADESHGIILELFDSAQLIHHIENDILYILIVCHKSVTPAKKVSSARARCVKVTQNAEKSKRKAGMTAGRTHDSKDTVDRFRANDFRQQYKLWGGGTFIQLYARIRARRVMGCDACAAGGIGANAGAII